MELTDFAGLALLLGPLQLSSAIRRRRPQIHRIGGWLYACAVAVGGIAALQLAPHAQGGWPTAAAFLSLGMLWLGCTGLALGYAIRRRIDDHRRWMLRSVALTFSAVTLRLYLALGLFVFNLGFYWSYLLAAWLSWTLHLLAVEIYLHLHSRSRASSLAHARGRPMVSPEIAA